MSYVTWTVVALLALTAFIVFLFLPGLAILAAIALGLAVVFAIVLLIGRGASGVGTGTTPDIIERRNESEARRRDRGMS